MPLPLPMGKEKRLSHNTRCAYLAREIRIDILPWLSKTIGRYGGCRSIGTTRHRRNADWAYDGFEQVGGRMSKSSMLS
jgi:hypothetical protein